MRFSISVLVFVMLAMFVMPSHAQNVRPKNAGPPLIQYEDMQPPNLSLKLQSASPLLVVTQPALLKESLKECSPKHTQSSYPFGGHLLVGVAGENFKPMVSYSLFSTKTVKQFGLSLGVFLSQNDSSSDRFDLGPDLILTYNHFFFGCGYRTSNSRLVTMFGTRW